MKRALDGWLCNECGQVVDGNAYQQHKVAHELHCDLCAVQCSSHRALEAHYKTKKHKEKLEDTSRQENTWEEIPEQGRNQEETGKK